MKENMDKRAIATDVMIMITVLFFVIIITTGTLFWLSFVGSKQQLIKSEIEEIDKGILLMNYLRTPSQINDKSTNNAELIIFAIKQDNITLIKESLTLIDQFFWEFHVLNKTDNIFIIEGNQSNALNKKWKKDDTKYERIIIEQKIPNYVGALPIEYTIRVIIRK